MQYRILGRTGLKVSEIGHGLWGMSNWSDSDNRESEQALQLSLDSGCTFYDSAWAYGDGKSDRFIGGLIRNNPGKHIVAASKIPPKNKKWPASNADSLKDTFPKDHVLEYAEKIAEGIGRPADLLQYHVWDDSWTDDPAFEATIHALKEKGLMKHFGLSLNRWQPSNGLKAIKTGLVDVVQLIYNIFDQAPEDELFPLCDKMDIGVIARVPLDEGSLGGKMTPETRFPDHDWRAGYFKPANLVKTLDRVEALKKIVPNGMTLPELAFRFILSSKTVSTTIPGMRKAGHVTSNSGYSDGKYLTAELQNEIRKHRWERTYSSWIN